MLINNKIKLRRYVFLALSILVAILIFILSARTANQSTKDSQHFVSGVKSVVNTSELVTTKKVELDGIEQQKVRKSAHVFIYAILGVCIVNWIITYTKIIKSMLLSSVICFLYACSDELHQMYVPGRGASMSDVWLDLGGAIFGIFVMGILVLIFRLIKEKKYVR